MVFVSQTVVAAVMIIKVCDAAGIVHTNEPWDMDGPCQPYIKVCITRNLKLESVHITFVSFASYRMTKNSHKVWDHMFVAFRDVGVQIGWWISALPVSYCNCSSLRMQVPRWLTVRCHIPHHLKFALIVQMHMSSGGISSMHCIDWYFTFFVLVALQMTVRLIFVWQEYNGILAG